MDGSSNPPVFSSLPTGYRIHDRLGVVYDRVPAGAQDLTEIQGVNTREAVVLNQLGMYTWAQVALWSHDVAVAVAQELNMSPRLIFEQRWIEQARHLCERDLPRSHTHDFPASLTRTTILLASALLFGFLCVYYFSNHRSNMLHGVLSAEISSLRVPARSRVVSSGVKPGDEVHSGEVLATLEKLEHLETIESQKARVRQLEEQLQSSEAKVRLDTDLQISEIERQLFDLRTQAALVLTQPETGSRPDGQHHDGQNPEPPQPQPAPGAVQTVSVRNGNARSGKSSIHRLIFFSGLTDQSNVTELCSDGGEVQQAEPAEPVEESQLPVVVQKARVPEKPNAEPAATPAAGNVAAAIEASSVSSRTEAIETRMRWLEDLRDLLPERIRMAAGVENLRGRVDEESCLLAEMQAASREIAVVSPAYGVVGQIAYLPGESLQPGDVLMKVLHTEKRFVTAYVPTDRVPELAPGTVVHLSFGDREEYEGVVSDVPLMAEPSERGSCSTAAVRLEPKGRLWPQLPIGSHVSVLLSE